MTFDNKNGSFMQVFKDTSHRSPYRVTFHSEGRLKNEENFKKKSQALKFANKYMKEHDKC